MLVKLALTPPHFIEVPVPTQESELSCICVLGVCISLAPKIGKTNNLKAIEQYNQRA
jgi:hypothetical protein